MIHSPVDMMQKHTDEAEMQQKATKSSLVVKLMPLLLLLELVASLSALVGVLVSAMEVLVWLAPQEAAHSFSPYVFDVSLIMLFVGLGVLVLAQIARRMRMIMMQTNSQTSRDELRKE